MPANAPLDPARVDGTFPPTPLRAPFPRALTARDRMRHRSRAVADRPGGQKMARMLDLTRSWKYFAAFFALALVAFWPTYLSRPGESSPYTHLHAATAALWMLLLVAQSWA